MKKAIRIEFPCRLGNVGMLSLSLLLVRIFGDPDKEYSYEEGGKVFIFEDTEDNVKLFRDVITGRSWSKARFDGNWNNMDFLLGASVLGGNEGWDQALRKVLDAVVAVDGFPPNSLGLKRGSCIICAHPDVQTQLGIPVGEDIPIGFDGTYVRSGPFTWDIKQLEDEIRGGFWRIADTIVDLSDEKTLEIFRVAIERTTS